jgi:hypothetical protein
LFGHLPPIFARNLREQRLEKTQGALKGLRAGKIRTQALVDASELSVPPDHIACLDRWGYGIMGTLHVVFPFSIMQGQNIHSQHVTASRTLHEELFLRGIALFGSG